MTRCGVLVNCGGGGKAILKPTGWVDGTLLTTENKKASHYVVVVNLQQIKAPIFVTLFNLRDNVL